MTWTDVRVLLSYEHHIVAVNKTISFYLTIQKGACRQELFTVFSYCRLLRSHIIDGCVTFNLAVIATDLICTRFSASPCDVIVESIPTYKKSRTWLRAWLSQRQGNLHQSGWWTQKHTIQRQNTHDHLCKRMYRHIFYKATRDIMQLYQAQCSQHHYISNYYISFK